MEKQKLIYVESKAQFSPSSVSNKAIVFIKDTKEIWTHGTYFICSNVWATPITLTLSGDSTGSVSIDGSKGVTLTANNKYLTGVATISDYNDAAPMFSQKLVYYARIGSGAVNGFPMSNNANAVLAVNTHNADYTHQLGFSSNKGIYHRTRNAGTWETSWREILTSTNYTKYPHTFASLTNKPTTISGYGITDSIPIIKGGEVTADTDLSTLGMTTTGYKFSISYGYTSQPSWLTAYTNLFIFRASSDFYSGIATALSGGHVTFLGGRNAETAPNNVPNWWFRIYGTNGQTYNLANIQTAINNLGSTYLPLTGGTLTDTLILKAGAFTASNSNSYSGGRYQAVAKPNMRLIGDSTYGLSTIEFVSQKGDTTINKPSDSGFIQFQPYGVSALSSVGSHPTLKTSGESNALVLGVTNDADDIIVLQSPNISGLRHACGATEYYLPHVTTSTTTANKPLVSTNVAHLYTLGAEYIPLSGGTMTGTLTLKGGVYTDAANTGALNANNSNIYGLNSLYFADSSETAAEGINFYRSSTTVDSLWGSNGNLFWTPNRTYGNAGTNYYVLTSNNYATHLNNTYLPLNGGVMTGQIQMTRGSSYLTDTGSGYSMLGMINSGTSTTGMNSEEGMFINTPFTQATLRTSRNNLWHYNHANSARYLILDANNYTNYTIPYAKANSVTGVMPIINNGNLWYHNNIRFLYFTPDDNLGAVSYLLIAELTNYGTKVNTSYVNYGLVGTIYGYRGGNMANTHAYNVSVGASIGPETYTKVYTSAITDALIPMIVKYDGKYYIALQKSSSSTGHYFIGQVSNLLSSYIKVNDSSLIEIVKKPQAEVSTSSRFYNSGNPKDYLHEGNYSNYALPLSGGTLTGTLTSSSIVPRTSVTYDIGTTSTYYNNICAQYFKRKDSSDSYVLLGGGGHKLLSDLSSAHTHDWSSITSKPSLLGAMAAPIFYPYANDSKLGAYISTINNRFYSADLRYTVTTTNLSGNKHLLFDDNYDDRMQMDPGTTATITIEGYNFVYNNGYIMLYFYLYNAYPLKFPKSITAKATVQSGTEYTLNRATAIESGNTIAFQIGLEYLTKLEFTIVSQDDAYCGITNIDYFTRCTENTTRDCAVVTKYNANTLYHNLTAPKYIVKNGTSSQFLKADGSLDSTSYLPKSGGTLGNTSATETELRLKSSTTTLRLVAHSSTTFNYIQSGNADFNGSTPLQITGYNGTVGSDLYLKFNNIYCRSGNYTNIDSGNYSSYALPLSGGTMTGALNFKNNTWNLVGDDVYIGDCNIGGMLGIKSANRDTPGFAMYNSVGTLLGKLYASGSNLYWADKLLLTESNYESYVNNLLYEANLKWGGGNKRNSFGPLDAALIDVLGANRMAFANPRGIEILYSRDGGETWIDYEVSDSGKTGLFTTYTNLYLGKAGTAELNSSNNQLRVIITSNLVGLYTELKKFAIFITDKQNQTTCTIEGLTKANVDSGSDTWTMLANSIGIGGNSGWSIINCSCVFGSNFSHQYNKLRLTFKQTAHSGVSSSTVIQKIYTYGGMGGSTPSTLAANGHLYSYNNSKEATFPAKVTAPSFSGPLTGNVTGNLTGNVNGTATSADKLNTNAGNSTTPVYFSNGIPVACTDYGSAYVHKAKLLACMDYRNNYPAQIVTAGQNIGVSFMAASKLGISGDGSYYDALIIRGYSDSSGGKENALLFSKNSSSVYHSQYAFGSTTTWGTLYKFLDSGNYKNYAPSLSGEGATGTWGINISGTANKVANALTLQLNSGTTSGTNKFVYDGAAAYTVNITPDSIGAAASSHTHNYLPLSGGTISSSSYGPLVIERSGSSTLMAAIKFKNASGDLGSIGIGSVNGDLLIYNAGVSAYRTILDSGNSSISENTTNKTCTIKINGTSKTVSSSTHTHNYLPLAGGTLGSSSANTTELRTQSSTAALRIMSYSDSTNYIQSGNSSFDGNATLKITGYSNVTGTNLYFKFNNIYCRDNDYINIDSGNYGSYALPLSGGTLTGSLNTSNIYPTANAGFNIGSTSSYYNTMYAYYFKKYGSDDNYLLLGGGGHKKISDFPQIQDKGIEGGSGGNTDNWVLVLNNNYSTGWYGPCTMFYIRSKNFGCGILCFYHYWNTEGTSGYYDNSVWFFGAEHSAYSGTMGGTGRDINNYLKVYIDKENADLKIYYNRYNNQALNVQELQFVHGPSGTLYPSGELRASHFINSTQAVELPTTSNTFVNIPIQTVKNHTEDIKTTRSVYASAFYENSDIRLKENVHSIDQIDLLKNVDLVQFNFKNDQNKKYGVIAQQLEQVGLNNLVYEHNGNKAVDYISLLVLETQRLRNEIKELKEKLDKKELSS